MAEPVEFQLKVTGGRRASAEMEKFEAALRKSEQSTRQLASAQRSAAGPMRTISAESRIAGRSLGMATNEITEMAMGFQGLSPKVRELTTSFAMMGNSAVTMGAAFGPIGVGVAALTMGLPALITQVVGTGDAMEASARQARTLADAIRNVTAAIEQRRLTERVIAGRGSAVEQIGAAQTSRENIRNLELALQSAHRRLLTDPSRDAQTAVATISEALSAEQRRQDVLEAEERRARFRVERLGGDPTERPPEDFVPGRPGSRPERRGGGGRGRRERREREARTDPRLGGEEIASPSILGGREQRFFESGMRRAARERASQEREADEARRANEEAYRAEVERTNNAWEYRLQLLQQESEARRMAIRDASDIAEGALELFGASQGQMELARGLSQVAQAIGSYPDPVGIAQHGISAALHFKNAAQLGVGGGGGAAGGGGATNRRPLPSGGGAGGGGGPATVTVNFNAPTDEAQLGRLLDRSSRAARRRFG